jgi:hypothetical protein
MRWVVSVTHRPRFSPGERTPGSHWIGGWMGLRASLNTEARGKTFTLPWIEPRSPGRPVRGIVRVGLLKIKWQMRLNYFYVARWILLGGMFLIFCADSLNTAVAIRRETECHAAPSISWEDLWSKYSLVAIESLCGRGDNLALCAHFDTVHLNSS